MTRHQQLSHAIFTSLLAFLKYAGIDDKEINKILERVANACEICLKYKKAPSWPVAGLSLARVFNKTVGWIWKNAQKTIVKLGFFT